MYILTTGMRLLHFQLDIFRTIKTLREQHGSQVEISETATSEAFYSVLGQVLDPFGARAVVELWVRPMSMIKSHPVMKLEPEYQVEGCCSDVAVNAIWESDGRVPRERRTYSTKSPGVIPQLHCHPTDGLINIIRSVLGDYNYTVTPTDTAGRGRF